MILYRISLVLLAPVLAIVFALRWLRGRETSDGLAERLALSGPPSPASPMIWVHGASLGELTAARSLFDGLLDRDPGLHLIVTMNTYTARAKVRGWGNARIHAQMAPLDYRFVIQKFCSNWSPRALVILENELWPNRLAWCRKMAVPVVIAGGRMSARAHSMWSRFASLSRLVIGSVSYLAPLDRTAADRFQRHGLRADLIGAPLLLKSAVSLPDPDPSALSRLAAAFERGKTILAASTHEGEDEVILRAFLGARATHPDLRLIIAPRHSDRAPAIARLLGETGLPFHVRSTGQETPPDCVILLADTTGEMEIWYALAGITLIAGTWVPKGGHTPFEPAQFSSAVIHGPSVENHAEAFDALDRNGGAIAAEDDASLQKALVDLLDEQRRTAQTLAATAALSPLRANAVPMTQLVNQIAKLSGL